MTSPPAQTSTHQPSWAKETERQQHLQRVYRIVSYVVVAFFLTLLFMLACGDEFADILGPLGLYNQGSGLYVDCRTSAGRATRYCHAPRNAEIEQTWKSLESGGNVPFTLYTKH